MGCCAVTSPTPLQTTSHTDGHSHWRTATPGHKTCHEHTYPLGAGFVQHNSHTTRAHEACQNPIEFQALREPHGPPCHRSNNHELQKVNAQICNGRGMADCVWQVFWRNGPRLQQDGVERHKCNVCNDAWWNHACTCGEKNLLCKSGRWLPPSKIWPPLH